MKCDIQKEKFFLDIPCQIIDGKYSNWLKSMVNIYNQGTQKKH